MSLRNRTTMYFAPDGQPGGGSVDDWTPPQGEEWRKELPKDFREKAVPDIAKEYVRLNSHVGQLNNDYGTFKQTAAQKEQAANIKEQNQHMAELYGIRGYPWVIILNYQGQRIGESKYQKGGPVPFLAEIDGVVKEDLKRMKPGL